MTKKEKAAFETLDKGCVGFQGDRKEHIIIQAAFKIIHAALNPETKKIEVPKKALPRDRKRKVEG